MAKKHKTFDRVVYDAGDIVIRKVKGKDEQPRVVLRTEVVGNLDDLLYYLVYFEDTPDEWNVSYEYEPNDPIERAEYYRIWNQKLVKKPIGKKNIQSKVGTKVLRFSEDTFKDNLK